MTEFNELIEESLTELYSTVSTTGANIISDGYTEENIRVIPERWMGVWHDTRNRNTFRPAQERLTEVVGSAITPKKKEGVLSALGYEGFDDG